MGGIMTKHILVCADDYGQTLPISQAIIALLKEKRLSAVSCMVTCEHWPEHAALLKPFMDEVDIGLHFNLTHGTALSSQYQSQYGERFNPLGSLLVKSQLRLIKKVPIADEFRAQWQRFTQYLGRTPNFVDGHQHVHQFPIVRDALVDSLLQQAASNVFVRIVNPRGWSMKKAIIKLSGTFGLQRLLKKHQIPVTTSFTGIYSFKDATQYRQYAQNFLREIKDFGLMMCHPGLEDPNECFPMSQSRPLEYIYLASQAFLDDLKAAKASITRFNYSP